MLPEQKRKFFLKAFGPERLAEIEAALEAKAKEADAAGLEKKAQQRRLPAHLAGSFTDWQQRKERQFAAIKAGRDVKAKEVDAWIPPDVQTFQQYDDWRAGQDKAAATMDLMSVFTQLVSNGGNPEQLAGELAERVRKVKSASLKQRLAPTVKELNMLVKGI